MSALTAELESSYTLPLCDRWLEVLVDCPGAQGVFTYRIPADLVVRPGDILSVPFGTQQVGAIALNTVAQLPPNLDPAQVKDIETVLSPGFFPPTYWELLNRVAAYYYTPLMGVVRAALPPGLLARSQRRVRLVRSEAVEGRAGESAAQILHLLQASKAGDYSWQHLQRQVQGASRGIHELLRLGLVENYLVPPSPVRPKQKQAVTLVLNPLPVDLTPKQQDVLAVLRRQGGEVWLADLLQLCRVSSGVIKTLVQKGCVVQQPREVLRSEGGIAIAADTPKSLTPDQTHALTAIQQITGATQVLLHGVTGSGKTEVYLQAIAPLLQAGKSALVLVPEIGLTPQLTDRFRARFGSQVCVYHSALSEGERYDTWRQMLTGSPQVVIGTRSAVFAPLPKLGLIVLDEEHDPSFKQDQPAPCYHARTVAQWRSQLDQCPIILGSATPSLESWVAAGEGAIPEQSPSTPRSQILSLPTRIQNRPMPRIEVVDMRQELHQGNRSLFSQPLRSALEALRDRGQQAILFMHRRGHSTFVSCRSCGYVVMCPHCDVSLSYHQTHAEATPLLRCHYCNFAQAVPQTCPSCDSIYFKHFGSGTQRVAQELTQQFPDLRVLRYDSDTTRAKGSHRALLTQFAAGSADVLVGTQMLTKGLDLPQVTLVGIVAADGLLHFADFRASERTFQTLTQVAGRCGRGEEPGRVILQTYTPDHAVIQAVQRQDYAAFAESELQQRSALHYPPCDRLILLRFSSSNPVAVQKAADRVAEALAPLESAGLEMLGPAAATILRVDRRFRWQILLKLPVDSPVSLPDPTELRALCASTVSLTVDVDPLHLL
ncbi:MAG TPA: primosomal protein N' [Thermosynechococcaceae cyanobacterium]